jgi:hypothetical protein
LNNGALPSVSADSVFPPPGIFFVAHRGGALEPRRAGGLLLARRLQGL